MPNDELIECLLSYNPRSISRSKWDSAREVAADAVLATGVSTKTSAQASMSRLASFVIWHPVWDRVTVPDLITLLDPKYIDSFVALSVPHRKARPHLRRIARALGAMPTLIPSTKIQKRPRARSFWTKVSALGPFAALVCAYRRRGNALMFSTFQGLIPELSGVEWDLGQFIGEAASARDEKSSTFEGVVRAAQNLRAAPDVEPTGVRTVQSTKATSVRFMATKPLSRTAAVRAAKAAQAVRTAALEERGAGKRLEPVLSALPTLDPVISTAITAFRPHRFTNAEWVLVGDATRAFATAYDPPSLAWVRTQMGILARFSLWVALRPARLSAPAPLRAVELLGVGLVEEYLAGPIAYSPDATRATVRSVLRRGVRRLAPDQAPATISYQPVQAPYAPYECAAHVRLARNQPTSSTRRGLSALVALGLGAGLSANEQRTVTPKSIHEVELLDGVMALFVEVGGRSPRIVVVRVEYEELLREALELHRKEGRKDTDPLYGQLVTRHNAIAPVTTRARTALGLGVDVDPARLRSTWLVACMSAPVPLGALLRASGLRSARTLVDLVAYCPEPDESVVSAALRVAGEVGT